MPETKLRELIHALIDDWDDDSELYQVTDKKQKTDEEIIEELSKDIEKVLQDGGDYEDIEDRIRRAPHDKPITAGIYDVFLDRVYSFVLLEAFIGRKKLIEPKPKNEFIRDIVNERLNDRLEHIDSDTPKDIVTEKNRLSVSNNKYKYLDPTLISLVFYYDDTSMTKEEKAERFAKEVHKVDTECSKKCETINTNIKKLRFMKTALLASIMAAALSIFACKTMIDRNPSLTSGPFNYFDDTPDKDEHALDFFILYLVLSFLCITSTVKTAIDIYELSNKLKLDKKKYNKLLRLLKNFNLIQNNTLDIDKLSYIVEEYYARENSESPISSEYRLVDHGIPIPNYLQHITTVDKEMAEIREKTRK